MRYRKGILVKMTSGAVIRFGPEEREAAKVRLVCARCGSVTRLDLDDVIVHLGFGDWPAPIILPAPCSHWRTEQWVAALERHVERLHVERPELGAKLQLFVRPRGEASASGA